MPYLTKPASKATPGVLSVTFKRPLGNVNVNHISAYTGASVRFPLVHAYFWNLSKKPQQIPIASKNIPNTIVTLSDKLYEGSIEWPPAYDLIVVIDKTQNTPETANFAVGYSETPEKTGWHR